ncbi:LysR family transcriptional regulator [Psychromonas aquimarina]|uniref:LysR family transcriptional regulator n=1 Tax=Psychromonas aquimarina TaxID=444919 RepID=UPI0003FC6F26|nr:LysR family transcriptional regulator [Psychromonas aquimarina]
MVEYSLDQLATFVAVAEHGTFANAAKILKRDRSTLSERVSNLEIIMGVALFDRTSNNPSLTKEGKLLLRQATLLLHQSLKLQHTALQLTYKEERELTICLNSTVPNEYVFQIDQHMSHHFSDTDLNWVYASRDEAMRSIIDSEVDLVIIIQNHSSTKLLPPPGLNGCIVGSLPGAIYTRKDSPMQPLSPVMLEDLQLEKQYILKSFADAGFSERANFSSQQQVITNPALLMELLKHFGWSFLPRHIGEDKMYSDTIVELKTEFLNESWTIDHTLFFREDKAGKVLKSIITEFKNQYSKLKKNWFCRK